MGSGEPPQLRLSQQAPKRRSARSDATGRAAGANVLDIVPSDTVGQVRRLDLLWSHYRGDRARSIVRPFGPGPPGRGGWHQTLNGRPVTVPDPTRHPCRVRPSSAQRRVMRVLPVNVTARTRGSRRGAGVRHVVADDDRRGVPDGHGEVVAGQVLDGDRGLGRPGVPPAATHSIVAAMAGQVAVMRMSTPSTTPRMLLAPVSLLTSKSMP